MFESNPARDLSLESLSSRLTCGKTEKSAAVMIDSSKRSQTETVKFTEDGEWLPGRKGQQLPAGVLAGGKRQGGTAFIGDKKTWCAVLICFWYKRLLTEQKRHILQ